MRYGGFSLDSDLRRLYTELVDGSTVICVVVTLGAGSFLFLEIIAPGATTKKEEGRGIFFFLDPIPGVSPRGEILQKNINGDGQGT